MAVEALTGAIDRSESKDSLVKLVADVKAIAFKKEDRTNYDASCVMSSCHCAGYKGSEYKAKEICAASSCHCAGYKK